MFQPRPLTENTLADLLNEGTERAGLDFKARCDLNDAHDKVAIVKDFAAMQLRGGYIVIGADDNGHPTGKVTEAEARLFDEATVRSKAQRYLAEGFELRSTALQVEENWFGLICVLPHPHRIAPMKANGSYQDANGRDRSEFSAGDVFARHGTRSERWALEDVRALHDEIRSRERDSARAEFQGLFTDLQRNIGQVEALAGGAATALDWNLTPDVLCNTVIEQLRRQDTIPVNLLIGHAQRDVDERLPIGAFDDAELILDHLVCLAATFVTVEHHELAQRMIGTLADMYDGAFRDGLMPVAFDSRRAARVGLAVITRVWALGALAVRRREWGLVPLLAGHRPDADGRDHYTTWLFHGAVMAARAELLNSDTDPTRGISVLLLAQEHVARLAPLRADLSDGEGVCLNSLCQFDMLACFVAIGLGMNTAASGNYFAQFGRWYAARSDPAALAVIQQPEVREQVFPMDDRNVALALLSIAREAQRMAGWLNGWDGYSNPRITEFVEQNTTADERLRGGTGI